MSTKTGRLHLRHDQELLDRVKEIADKRGVTVTFIVDQLLRQLVKDEDMPRTDEELGVEQA